MLLLLLYQAFVFVLKLESSSLVDSFISVPSYNWFRHSVRIHLFPYDQLN